MPGKFVGYRNEIERIEEAIMQFNQGQAANIAIIAGPYAGKTVLLDNLYYSFPLMSARIAISADWEKYEHSERELSNAQEKVIFIDDCHLLYQRRVGGFELLKKLLDYIAAHPEHLFITSWNIFSWNYLNEVLHVEKHFPTQIHLSGLETDDIRSVLMSPYRTGEVIFENGNRNVIKRFLAFERYPLQVKGLEKTINIPFLRINLSLLGSILKSRLQQQKKEEKKEKRTPEDMVFTRIRDISSGNIMLAQIIWNRSLLNSVVKADEIYSPSFKAEFDYDIIFVGFLILSMGRITKNSLENAVGDEIDVLRSLAILRKHEIIDTAGSVCSVRPEAVQYIESLAKDRRII